MEDIFFSFIDRTFWIWGLVDRKEGKSKKNYASPSPGDGCCFQKPQIIKRGKYSKEASCMEGQMRKIEIGKH